MAHPQSEQNGRGGMGAKAETTMCLCGREMQTKHIGVWKRETQNGAKTGQILGRYTFL